MRALPVAVYGPQGCGRCYACAQGKENYCEHAAELGIFPVLAKRYDAVIRAPYWGSRSELMEVLDLARAGLIRVEPSASAWPTPWRPTAACTTAPYVAASSSPRNGADRAAKRWYRTASLARSPWSGLETEVLAAEAETPLERRLSLAIMRAGTPPPKAAKIKAGETILAQGAAAEGIVLLLDGVVEVEADGTTLATLGPGAVLGERASLEQGRRTATVRALTSCRIVSFPAAALPAENLRQLAAGHHREEQQQQ